MAEVKVGKVTHYYDKLGVAVIELTGDLAIGDEIRFVRGGEDLFEQKVGSLQVEHEQLEKAGAGQIVGMKTDQEVKDAAEVYKIS